MGSGAVRYQEFMDGIHNGLLPYEKLTEVDIRKLFIDKGEKEDYGFDFRAFLILMK